MLAVGLDIPLISTAAMVLAGMITVQQLLRARHIGGGFLWRLGLLFAAATSYCLLSVSHGFLEPPRAAALAAAILSGFVAGYGITCWCGDDMAHEAIWGLFFGVIGAAVYAGLTVLRGASLAAEVLPRDEVHVASLWSGDPLTATVLGAQSSLAICMLPAALFWDGGAERRRALALRAAAGACGAVGLYANLVLQNRNPFVSGAAALLAGVAFVANSRQVSGTRKAVLLLPLAPAVAVAVAALGSRISGMPAFQRFESEGLGTARYEVWREVLAHLLDNLTGDRVTRISELAAHNLWLDIAWDTGPVAFALMAMFHLSIAGAVPAILRRGALLERLAVAGAGIAFASVAVAEPAMTISIGYATLLFYFCGFVAGFHDLLRSPRRASAIRSEGGGTTP